MWFALSLAVAIIGVLTDDSSASLHWRFALCMVPLQLWIVACACNWVR